MSLEHYTSDDLGTVDRPEDRDWNQWVSASRTRNWCKSNPLQDWLGIWGAKAGFDRDADADPRTDFREFVFAQGHAFEAEVLRLLSAKAGLFAVQGFDRPTQSLEACRVTFDAMVRGEPLISQGVLWNPENRTYGAADLLVRSDILRAVFPDALSLDDACLGAPGIGLRDRHYRVVDVKFATLHMDKRWNASLGHLPYMAQVFVYNQALGRIQGFLPDASYLLGRSWTGPGAEVGSSCLERLAPVPNDHCSKQGSLAGIVADSVSWVRRVRNEGANWHPISGPTVPELRPNPSSADFPWQGATRAIAEATNDPILAWQVGCAGRESAADAGITTWTDAGFNAMTAAVTGIRGAKLDLILDLARDPAAPAVYPARILTERETWLRAKGVEFFVDFETVSDINDDFSALPERCGQAMIFMIGCGHFERGEWQFASFVADALNVADEAAIVEGWLSHMEEVRLRLAPQVPEPLVFHWSPAESSGLTNGLKSARTRHPKRSQAWREPNWFDFLGRVMRAEPVVVKGPMAFGLKTVAKSLKRHGLIETDWEDNITDGLGAMVGAWRAYGAAGETGTDVQSHELLQAITRYNEVDCRVMMETIGYLRENH